MTILPAGITPAGSGKAAPVGRRHMEHPRPRTYWLKAQSEECFAFETLDPPGTFVPPHVHPTQDEFIYMLEGTFDLYLDGSWTKAGRRRSRPHAARHAARLLQSRQTSRRARCSGSRRRASCARCSISCTISAIPRRWCAAQPPTRWISCRRAACRAREAQTKPATEKGARSSGVAFVVADQGVSRRPIRIQRDWMPAADDRLGPLTPGVTVSAWSVQATEPLGSTPPSEPIW